MPTHDLSKAVVGIGNCSGAQVDKFEKFALTAEPASDVGAPLIAECYANLECQAMRTQSSSIATTSSFSKS